MEAYTGTKTINATPMTRGDYNVFRGWTLPEDESPDDEGYLVEYTDGGKANTDTFEGYVSWSPKDVFEGTYKADIFPKILISDKELGERLKDRPAPSVTREYIESRIESNEFSTMFGTVTVCSIVLDNGYSVRGESACVNPENYDEEIGVKLAYNNAFAKLWPLFGFLLAEGKGAEVAEAA